MGGERARKGLEMVGDGERRRRSMAKLTEVKRKSEVGVLTTPRSTQTDLSRSGAFRSGDRDCRQVFLEDAASQELLAAVENERNARSRCVSMALINLLLAAGLIQILSEDDILSEDIASIVTIPSPIIPASQATSFIPLCLSLMAI
nr:E3 ubiquitin-protein ligase RHF1A-like isoform X3 [Ipomoea batatas]